MERAQRQSQPVAAGTIDEEREQAQQMLPLLPPELRLELTERMADAQPHEVMTLYQTNRAFHDVVDHLQHSFYTIREPGGAPTGVRLPLIEYVRLTANFGPSGTVCVNGAVYRKGAGQYRPPYHRSLEPP